MWFMWTFSRPQGQYPTSSLSEIYALTGYNLVRKVEYPFIGLSEWRDCQDWRPEMSVRLLEACRTAIRESSKTRMLPQIIPKWIHIDKICPIRACERISRTSTLQKVEPVYRDVGVWKPERTLSRLPCGPCGVLRVGGSCVFVEDQMVVLRRSYEKFPTQARCYCCSDRLVSCCKWESARMHLNDCFSVLHGCFIQSKCKSTKAPTRKMIYRTEHDDAEIFGSSTDKASQAQSFHANKTKPRRFSEDQLTTWTALVVTSFISCKLDCDL